MTESDKQPEFDPATWTPDQPWPKGYYKPVTGLQATVERMDRAGGDGMGHRFALWVMLGAVSQWIGAAAARPTPYQPFGMAATAIQQAIGAWPLPIFFIAVLPAILYAVMVPPQGVRFWRGFAYGLGWALALRVALMLVLALLPFRHAVAR
jgi:hypothetical protein